MPRRLAACEACRIAKVACDHGKPQCSRCCQDWPEAPCIYRDRPFKRKKAIPRVPSHQSVSSPSTTTTTLTRKSARGSYPNPGYLGSSSHSTIFKQFDDSPQDSSNALPMNVGDDRFELPNDGLFDGTVRAIEQARGSLDLVACSTLITQWLSAGFNLALAGSFTQGCADAAVKKLRRDTSTAAQLCKDLFNNSARPFSIGSDHTLESYRANFCSVQSARLETIGIFFTSLSRAFNDVHNFDTLFRTREERRKLQKIALALSDACLEAAISLDCLNDLQLVLQYESFIAHSVADGDQSYHSWRRLGDVIGTLFALGYHEQIDSAEQISDSRKDLRRAALARVYSADKNLGIFLGRPMRLPFRFCRSQLPLVHGNEGEIAGDPSSKFQTRWPSGNRFDYLSETRWSALCATIKEQIVDLSEERDGHRRCQKVSDIRAQSEVLWLDLPSVFRWDGTVRDLHDRNPIERDFMISARLNHLHIQFLLDLAIARNLAAPQPDLVSTAAAMLRLVVDGIIFKDRLINSGTSIVWKTAHYGLPAAGVLCISLLNNPSLSVEDGNHMVKTIQDLGTLVVQIEAGVLVDVPDPNYALFAKAAQGISSVLHRLITPGAASQGNEFQQQYVAVNTGVEWMPWSASQNTFDFELDFWLNLGGHPELAQLNNESITGV